MANNNKKSEESLNSDTSAQIKVYDPTSEINKNFDFYIKIVVGVLIVAVATMLLTVVGMVIETWRFNSTVYKEFESYNKQEKLLDNTLQLQDKIIQKLEKIDQSVNKNGT